MENDELIFNTVIKKILGDGPFIFEFEGKFYYANNMDTINEIIFKHLILRLDQMNVILNRVITDRIKDIELNSQIEEYKIAAENGKAHLQQLENIKKLLNTLNINNAYYVLDRFQSSTGYVRNNKFTSKIHKISKIEDIK